MTHTYKMCCFMCKTRNGGKRQELLRILSVCLFWRTTRMYTLAVATLFCWRNPINRIPKTETHSPSELQLRSTSQAMHSTLLLRNSMSWGALILIQRMTLVTQSTLKTETMFGAINRGRFRFDWYIKSDLSWMMPCFNTSISHHCDLTQELMLLHHIHPDDRDGADAWKC
jgi:hypothetical protein